MDTSITNADSAIESKLPKVNLMRMSGLPPLAEDYNKFSDSWKAYFDLVQEYYAQDQKAVHVRLERYERLLKLKFKNVVEIDMPNTVEMWSQLIDATDPVLVAKEKDTGNLILVIADQM